MDKTIDKQERGDKAESYFINEEPLEPEEYVQWVQDKDNRLKKEKNIEDITFTVQYKPHEYIACMEERTPQISEERVKEKVAQLSDMQYFDLKIELVNGQGELLKYKLTSPAEYEKRISYLAFEMQNDIKLVEGNDTLPCNMYHFERAYDVAPFSKILLGFPISEDKDSNKTIIFYDRIFNKGMLKFTFTKDELINIPKLKTS